MIITYLGKQCFKITQGDLTIAFNPVGKDSKSGIKTSRFGADIACVSLRTADYDGIDTVTHGDRTPFVIQGPGDYEIKDIFIIGSPAAPLDDGMIPTVYTFTLDGISLAFLGPVAPGALPSEAREAIGGADVLFIPIGGKETLAASEAYKLAVATDAKIIIPMDYGADREKDMLKIFLKEGGNEKLAAIDKLVLKRKDLEGKEGEIVVLATE